MSVTSGFFNSVNHDRLYNAEQFSSIFDGIVTDGIFQGVGEAFKVRPYSEANDTVIVGTGRAWFDHTWTLNDAQLAMVLDPPGTLLKRIDAIVIDVNKENDTRSNSIAYVKGIPSDSPQRPELIKTEMHKQYPLVYINRNPTTDNAPVIASDITNMIGTDECPLVTGILETLDLDMFVQQMESKFNIWFDGLENALEGNVALNLQNQIDKIKEELENQASNLIDSETLEKAKNTKISVSAPFTFQKSSNKALLPDGYAIEVGIDDTSFTEPKKVKVSLINADGVKNQTVDTISVYNATELVSLCSWDIPESYPATLYFGIGSTDWTKTGLNGKVNQLIYHFLKVTVTSDHVVSHTDVSSTVSGVDSMWSTSSYDFLTSSPLVPAFDANNGSLLTFMCYSACYNSGDKHNDTSVCLYKLTSDGVASHGPLRQNSNLPYIDKNPFIYTRKDSDDYPDIAVEDNDGSIIFDRNTLAYKSHSYNSKYASNLSQIYVKSNYMSKYKNASTLSIYENSYVTTGSESVPYSMEFNFSLNPPTSFGTPTSATISKDRNVIIAATSNAMRVGVRPDNGVMAWSTPYTGANASALANSGLLNSMLFTPCSWWTNSDKTVYKILMPGSINISGDTITGSSFPIGSFEFTNKGYIITIKFGG